MERGSRTADYDFELPSAQIAQTPLEQRASSRLLIVDRQSGRITHGAFTDLIGLAAPGDALVLNTTKVIRARLLGKRSSGAAAEILLLRALGNDRFEAMVSPGGKLLPGRVIHVAPGFDVDILETTERRTRIVQVRCSIPVQEAISRYGHVPLPPYIWRRDDDADAERYQTVYAREEGSVAAPTAGLHFTDEVLESIESRGVRRVDVVLHVGAGTFKPVETADPADHHMHEEWYSVGEEAACALNETRSRGAHVWAVGTTSVRTLESAASADGSFAATEGDTRLFIRPGYRFRAVDKLVTNFHLPRSTLIMLVAAFAGYDLTTRAYREAIHAGYRFYSYGDAMAVV
ncbi:MAG: tRNA preQ1(34) S-adenosylmethionine ribosyltransferase-isomerase QueA [Anaerolineae bacterium]|nr:tRNA preQ1(34) S-adenosylmethionine ribosyltransferase-isomerase QueA [Gemmatimonadaceae bacterium]